MTDLPLAAHGGIDLSSLAKKNASTPAAGAGAFTVHVDTESFNSIVEESARVPVIVALCAEVSEPCKELVPMLEEIADAKAGQFLLAIVDVQANPEIAQSFQVQAVPSVVALIGGRPAPLFQGTATREQLEDIIGQVLELAAQTGVTGSAEPQAVEAEPPAEEPLPPLHQQAFDAIEAGDLDAADAAYRKAIAENPKDADAKAGLAQVGLLSRTKDADLAAVRKAAADAPEDIDAQLAVADLDVTGGQVGDAFARLLDLIRSNAGDDRERVRSRLLELFDVVGADDPRVAAARRDLSLALF